MINIGMILQHKQEREKKELWDKKFEAIYKNKAYHIRLGKHDNNYCFLADILEHTLLFHKNFESQNCISDAVNYIIKNDTEKMPNGIMTTEEFLYHAQIIIRYKNRVYKIVKSLNIENEFILSEVHKPDMNCNTEYSKFIETFSSIRRAVNRIEDDTISYHDYHYNAFVASIGACNE